MESFIKHAGKIYGHHHPRITENRDNTDDAGARNFFKNFARDVGPQSIGMYLSIPSRDILSPKSKYSNWFDVRPTLWLDYKPMKQAVEWMEKWGDTLLRRKWDFPHVCLGFPHVWLTGHLLTHLFRMSFKVSRAHLGALVWSSVNQKTTQQRVFLGCTVVS